MKIQNSVAIVTGANRGIGKALVEALVSHGATKVYAAMRDVKSSPFEKSSRIVPIALDVTKESSIAAAAKQASDVTILFNNAGVLDFGSILEVPLAQAQRNMDINYYGKLAMARAFAPVLVKNGTGAIVNALTLVALASMPGLSVYNASKAAAWSMTLSLRASLAGSNIAVHSVFPGAVDTDMLKAVDMPKTSAQDVAKAIVEGINAGTEDIFPDPMSRQLYAAWAADHKAVEKQFASM